MADKDSKKGHKGICYKPALAFNTHNDIMYSNSYSRLSAYSDSKNRATSVLLGGGDMSSWGGETYPGLPPPDKAL